MIARNVVVVKLVEITVNELERDVPDDLVG